MDALRHDSISFQTAAWFFRKFQERIRKILWRNTHQLEVMLDYLSHQDLSGTTLKWLNNFKSEAWGGKKGLNIHHLREIHDSNSKPPKQTQISTIFLIKLFEYHGLFYKVTLQLCEIMTSLLNRPTRTHSSFLTIHSVSKIPIQYGSIFNVIFTKNKFQDDAFSLRSKTCICRCMHTWPEFI